jgi:hypothetical protein
MVKHCCLIVAFELFVLFGAVQLAMAGPEECQDALDAYNSAASDLEAALQSYSSCISGSDGKDDCSGDFGSLQSAQSDFESAVSEYGSECS